MNENDLIEKLICPEICLEIGEAKLYLRGPDAKMNQWIEAPKARNLDKDGNFAPTSTEDLELIGAEIFSRIMRACVQKVDGVVFNVDGKEIEYKVEKDARGVMTIRSYTALMFILNKMPGIVDTVDKFYKDSLNVDKYISIKKKI